MGRFSVGDVVLIAFPYADFSQFKRRPALVVGRAEFNNLILCQITSSAKSSQQAIALTDNDFVAGGLNRHSYVRPDKLFTIEQSIIETKVGSISKAKLQSIRLKIRGLFS